jgi:hypothetical protein
MLIPLGQVSTATLKGKAYKNRLCECCNAEFFYLVEREAIGSGSSLLFLDNQGARDRAAANAEKSLQAVLDKAFEIVHCPQCGWLQKEMVAAERKKRFKWCINTSLVFSMILLMYSLYLFGMHSKNSYLVFLSALASALAGLGLGIFWRIKHDPNQGHGGVGTICQERAQASRAILRSEFEAQMRRIDS